MSNFPTVDQSNPKPRIGREKEKNKKYNLRDSPPLSETDKTYLSIDWDKNLPAFPVTRSAAVVIGKVTSADAYLSDDLTNVYSEFGFQIDEVLKNDTKTPLKTNETVMVERLGGRVRFSSGKVAVSIVSHQDMPRVGTCYVLFLTHDFLRGGKYDEFFILTGYELTGGQVFPLDKVLSAHPIAKFTGTDVNSFMTELKNALAN